MLPMDVQRLHLISTTLHSTLKVFRKGEPSDYAGTREADGIVSYMKKSVEFQTRGMKQD